MAETLRDCLVQDLQLLHDDRDSADLEFLISGSAGGKVERIRAHRLVVLFRCRRYWSKKQSWLSANTPVVTVQLEHTEPETARRLVRYLYTGQVSVQVQLDNLHFYGCVKETHVLSCRLSVDLLQMA